MSSEHLDKKRNEAIAYYDMKRYDQAEKLLMEILSYDPEDSFVLYLRANCCYMLDKYDESEKICGDLLTTYLAEDAFRLMGKIARETKHHKKSEEYLLKALELDPQNAETLAEYGYLLLLCGYFKKADEVMKEAVRIDPEDSIVLHYKYYFEHAIGGKRKENEAIGQYVNYSSDEVQNLMKIGLTEYKHKCFKDAREHFRQAFILEPTNDYILEMLEELNQINHFVFFPNRLFSRIHPVVRFVMVPIATVIILVLLSMLDQTIAAIYIIGFYVCIFLLVIWSWLSTPIYKAFFKGK